MAFKVLGERIRYYREAKKISQEQLGKKVGLTRQHVNRIERGERGTTIERLNDIAEVLGISLNELIDENTPPQIKKPSAPETNEEGRVLNCLKCGSDEIYSVEKEGRKAFHCAYCGTSLYNLCSADASHVNPPRACFCIFCGEPTTWNQRGFLDCPDNSTTKNAES